MSVSVSTCTVHVRLPHPTLLLPDKEEHGSQQTIVDFVSASGYKWSVCVPCKTLWGEPE